MLAFQDTTVAVDEPESAHLEARTQPSVKDTINRAATLNGVNVGSFVVSAAYNAAQSTIEAHKVTVIESWRIKAGISLSSYAPLFPD